MQIRLSQGQLNSLETCPRKFQHLYLDQLGAPLPLETRSHQVWGSRFHLLMQQLDLGLDLPQQLEDPTLTHCVENFRQHTPYLFAREVDGFRESEHRRTLEFGNYLLTVIYDLVILEPESAQIHDWKTYPKPEQGDRLRDNWQTRLYLFVLAETSAYVPSQISMTYWFVRSHTRDDEAPESIQIPYSDADHDRTRQDLQQKLDQLSQFLQDYQQGAFFPQVPESSGKCQHCPFTIRCQRHPDLKPLPPETLLDVTQIEEVAL